MGNITRIDLSTNVDGDVRRVERRYSPEKSGVFFPELRGKSLRIGPTGCARRSPRPL